MSESDDQSSSSSSSTSRDGSASGLFAFSAFSSTAAAIVGSRMIQTATATQLGFIKGKKGKQKIKTTEGCLPFIHDRVYI